MKVAVYNKEGKETSQTLLPKEIFGVELSSDLLHQVVVSQLANKRRSIAHTKTRSEVSGGGRKPWRQKGTGRARHGSRRSPIWIGGGTTFGPRKEKNFKREIPKKMRKKALFMALSEKARRNFLIVLEELKVTGNKTKEVLNIFKNLPCFKKNCLVVLPNYDKNLILAFRNLKNIKTIEARNINALDLLSFKYLIMTKETIRAIKSIFVKSKEKETEQ